MTDERAEWADAVKESFIPVKRRGWGKTAADRKAALDHLRATTASGHQAEPLAERRRIANYQRTNGSQRITPAQRRRWLKKAMANNQWARTEEWYTTMVGRAEGHWPDYTIEFHARKDLPAEVTAALDWVDTAGPGLVRQRR